jgi:cytochrome c peroxidase
VSALLLVALSGCGDGSADRAGNPSSHGPSLPSTPTAPTHDGSPAITTLLFDPLAKPPGFSQALADTAPPDNLLTEARAQLGRRLFHDPALSRDNTVSCASCHQQQHGFAEPLAVSEGVDARVGSRNAPHLANLAWVRGGFFWDGSAATLEEQTIKPIENPLEMDLALDEAVERLAADESYVAAFDEAYGQAPSDEALARALASFLRTLVSTHSPYDRFLAGESALSEAAQRGRTLFISKANCFHCHSEQTLTNDGYFNNGTFVESGDVGRQALTGRTGDLGKFRVPSLRNVAVTAPYMHDGSLATLRDVVDHYARGGNGHPSTDVQVEPLELTDAEKSDLLDFLDALTDMEFLSDERFGP